MSETTTSGGSRRIASQASTPSAAATTSWPYRISIVADVVPQVDVVLGQDDPVDERLGARCNGALVVCFVRQPVHPGQIVRGHAARIVPCARAARARPPAVSPSIDEGLGHQLGQVCRELDADPRAPADFALHGDRAPHQLDVLLDDRQSDPRALVAAGAGTIDLAEPLENGGQLVRGNSDPRVRDVEPDAGAEGLQGQLDGSAFGELDGVPDEVRHDALELASVDIDRRDVAVRPEDERKPLVLGHLAERGDRVPEARPEVGPLQVEGHPTGLDPGEIEHLIDQIQQFQGAPVCRFEQVVLAGQDRPGVPEIKALDRSDDRGQRRPDLVADVREELRLEGVELLQLLVGPGQVQPPFQGVQPRPVLQQGPDDGQEHRDQQEIIVGDDGGAPGRVGRAQERGENEEELDDGASDEDALHVEDHDEDDHEDRQVDAGVIDARRSPREPAHGDDVQTADDHEDHADVGRMLPDVLRSQREEDEGADGDLEQTKEPQRRVRGREIDDVQRPEKREKEHPDQGRSAQHLQTEDLRLALEVLPKDPVFDALIEEIQDLAHTHGPYSTRERP